MKLFFDCRYIRTGVHDGISRYSASLIHALAQLQRSAAYPGLELHMIIHDPQILPKLPDLPSVRVSSPTSPSEPFLAVQLNRFQPEVVFSPMQTMGSAGREYRLILTLHDLIYYRHRTPPHQFPQWLRAGWWLYHSSYFPQRYLLHRADAVATVSQTTRELIAQHRLSPQPAVVIPNAATTNLEEIADGAPSSHAAGSSSAELRRELVYMGSFMEYKNVPTLVTAINALPGYRLHLCSPISPAQRAALRALAHRPSQLVFHQGISDTAYHQLLKRAAALVTLSRDEGYGLPIIEAMSHGTPVVVSDIAIFREVSGGPHPGVGFCALDSDAQAAADLVAHMRALEDPDAFAAARAAATAAAQRYQWQDSAHRLLALAEQVFSRGSRR